MACARDLEDYAEIQRLTETADGFGGYTKAWAHLAYIWCQVTDTSGGESYDAGRLQTDTSATFLTHYRSDVTVKDKIILDSIEYNIRRVDNVDRKSDFTLLFGDSGVVSG